MRHPFVLAILGIALLSVMDALIKGLIARLPVFEVTWLRYLVGSAAMVIILCVARPGWPSGESIRANLVRAVLVVVTATTFFYALGQLPLAEVLVLSFISPVATVFFAALLLGERLDRRVAAALASGFAGVAVIAAPNLIGRDVGGSLSGVVAVLVSAIGYSATNVLLRARARRDPLVTIVAIQNIAPAFMLAAPGAWVWTTPASGDALQIGAIGLFGVSGHLLLARAYAKAEATRLAPFDYTALLWGAAMGFAVFDEIPTLLLLAGGLLIVLAAWLASRTERAASTRVRSSANGPRWTRPRPPAPP